MKGISTLVRKAPKSIVTLLQGRVWERGLPTSQEVGSHQILNLQAPQSWTSRLKNCQKKAFVVG